MDRKNRIAWFSIKRIELKVTIVYPDRLSVNPKWKGHFYEGVGGLSAVLKRAGIITSLIHLTASVIQHKDFLIRLEQENPDILAFSSTTLSFPVVRELAKLTKEMHPDILILCGGIHPTINPEDAIATFGIDVVCRGEGEGALLDLCHRLQSGEDYTNIPNLWVRTENIIHRNPIRSLIQDLNTLPFADRDIFDYKNLYMEQQGWGCIMVSRGCPFNCSYCCNHKLREINKNGGKYIRFRSVDNVIAEMEYILNRYSFIHYFHFDDDLPFLNQIWSEEFSEKYKERINLPFRFNLRPDSIDEKQLQKLHQAGATEVKIGLESGNEYIANKILNRNLQISQVEKTFHMCQLVGMKTWSFNMVGIPEETPSRILDTIKLNARIQPDIVQVSIFFPFPGTDIWQICMEKGYLTDYVPMDFFSESAIKLDNLSKRQIEFFHSRFHFLLRLYRLVMGNSKDEYRLRIRLLDWSLCFETTRRLWGFGIAMLLLLVRFVKGCLTKIKIHVLKHP